MKKQRILLLAPSFMDLYKDIIEGMENKGFTVEWVEDDQIQGNPIRRLDRNAKTQEEFDEEVSRFWQTFFSKGGRDNHYDFFIAIGGLMSHKTLFYHLRSINPSIKTSLYLFDRVDGVYEVNVFFQFYDKIFSFDINDCEKYKLIHLPIYWVNDKSKYDERYDIFGFASYSSFKPERTQVFRTIQLLSEKLRLSSYIKLYKNDFGNQWIYNLKRIIKLIQGRGDELPNLKDNLITTKTLSPFEFRGLIKSSKVILDTQAAYQDGLTARFMWALGYNKKIITTNKHVIHYDFYNPKMIFILDKNYDDLEAFIASHESENYNNIYQYRIDNWLDTILDFL